MKLFLAFKNLAKKKINDTLLCLASKFCFKLATRRTSCPCFLNLRYNILKLVLYPSILFIPPTPSLSLFPTVSHSVCIAHLYFSELLAVHAFPSLPLPLPPSPPPLSLPPSPLSLQFKVFQKTNKNFEVAPPVFSLSSKSQQSSSILCFHSPFFNTSPLANLKLQDPRAKHEINTLYQKLRTAPVYRKL